MSEINSKWYKQYEDIADEFSGFDSYDTIYSGILSGQNAFSLNSKVMQKSVDITWVEAIENAMIHLDNVIRNPRKTIEDVESVVPIALSRKITVESIKHLAQHTNLIQDYDQATGKVTPSKVLNVYKEESWMTYENKFINTLINRLYIFINRRYDKLKEVRNDEAVSSLEYNSQVGLAESKMNISLKLETVDSLETVDESGSTVWERIEKIKRTVVSYKGSQFCSKMGTSYIRPPVMRTNAIMKNVDLKACLTLWQFIESYDKVGYELTVTDTAQKPDEDYFHDMYKLAAMGFMLMRYHSERDNGSVDLKTKVNKPLHPKIIRKFDPEGQDDLDVSVNVSNDEKKPGEYSSVDGDTCDSESLLSEFDKIIELENAFFEEEEQRILEEKRIAEEKERKRQEEERIRREQERLAAIQAEKERIERERKEREEEERKLREMRERQKREQEELERQRILEEEKRERERLEKIRLEAEEAARKAAEEAERIRKEAEAMSEEERQRLALEAERERIRKEEEKAARLERERIEAERAKRLREERQLIEKKPFEQIYLEYSHDPNAVIRRNAIRLAKQIGLIKEKPLSEIERGIKEIEDRCMIYYHEEQDMLYKERTEKRADLNYQERCSPTALSNMRIFLRNMAQKRDDRMQEKRKRHR